MIHGFTGSPAHMRLIGEGLREKGFAVRGILLPGHGQTPDKMKDAAWQDWRDCVFEHAREMRKKYPYFTVAGLSMGGCLSLLTAENMNVTACVTIAAPMKTTAKFRSLAPVAAIFCPMIHKRADGARDGVIQEYDIGYDSYPTITVKHLSIIMEEAKKNLSAIRCPLLVIQSRKDKTVTEDSPQIILNSSLSLAKDQLWLENAPHVCTISPEYPKIVEKMAAFLRLAEGKQD